MEQKNFQFATLNEAVDAINLIRDEYKGKEFHDALIHIYTTGIPGERVQKLIDVIKKELPEFKCIGISEVTGEVVFPVEFVVLNIILSDETEFHVVQIDCAPGEELKAGKTVEDMLNQYQDVKGVEVYPSNHAIEVSGFLKIVSMGHEDIPFWGAMAVNRSGMVDGKAALGDSGFGIGDRIVYSGFSVVLYTGKNLEINADYILGWKAVGREMEYTVGKRTPVGEGALKTIDNMPAVDIYKKYLGVKWNENFVFNVCEFPLMVQRDGMDICFMPIYSENGELYFSGVLYSGEKLRLSYSTPEEILGASKKGSERMREFSPDAVLLSMCFNRIFYLGKDAHAEWDYFKRYNPEAANYHGSYEIFKYNKKGGVLNSAIVAVGLREGVKKDLKEYENDEEDDGYLHNEGIIPISYRISKFFNVMTDELVHLQNNLEEEVYIKTKEVEALSLHIIQSLAQTIDAKDKYTNGHSERVAKYAMEIARRAGYSQKQQEDIYVMGLLHDVGKIGIADAVINKPGRLTKEEFDAIKEHPVIGADILRKIREMPNLMIGARWHHEKYDGSGYPDGLKGNEIPIEARIIAVADAYDAMTSNRSYRNVLPQEVVRKEIEEGSGSQFDPLLAGIMVQIIDEDTRYNMREND